MPIRSFQRATSPSLSPAATHSSASPVAAPFRSAAPPALVVPLVAPAMAEPRTRLQKCIRQPKIYKDGTVRYGLLTVIGEPQSLSEALDDANWSHAMKEEYDALIKNKTWHLVPPVHTEI